MNLSLLEDLVEERDELLEALAREAPATPTQHVFNPAVRRTPDRTGFLRAFPDLAGYLGCATCGASRFNPTIHIEP